MSNYSSMKLELLGLKWAVAEKFRDMLIGAKFVVYTDNNPLSYVKTTGKLGATETGWAAELARSISPSNIDQDGAIKTQILLVERHSTERSQNQYDSQKSFLVNHLCNVWNK